MTEREDRPRSRPPDVGSYRIEPGRAGGTAWLSAAGADPADVLLTALRGLLAAARGDHPAADLLAQLDANGLGLDEIRLDGLLRTDDGGYSAWGYVTGATAANPPPLRLRLDGEPLLTRTGNTLVLRCRLSAEC